MSNSKTEKNPFITARDVAACFPERPAECNKGDFGYVALVGGSLEYSGAIRLAALANAAMRSGAGVATIAAPRSICPVIAGSVLEVTLFPLSEDSGELRFEEAEFAALCLRYKCIAFGMGIGNFDETAKAVEYLLTHYRGTLIIDADGLNAMARLERSVIRNSAARLVLTPHVKEFSRLSGAPIEDIKAAPAESAKALANELCAVVLLKGSTTAVAGPLTDDPRYTASQTSEDPDCGGGLPETGTAKTGQKVLLTDRGCPTA